MCATNNTEDINYDYEIVYNTVQELLDKTFPNIPQKRKIDEYDNRIQFACPYCLDSKERVNEKRGMVWLDTLKYVCYNCGFYCYYDELMKKYGIRIDTKSKQQIYKYLSHSKKAYFDSHSKKTQDFISERFNNLVNLDELMNVLSDINNNNPIFDLKPLDKNSEQYRYLKSRSLHDKQLDNIYQANYWLNKDRTRYEPIIVFLNRKNKTNEIIGLQTRNLKEGDKRRFKIYNYESTYKLLLNIKDDDEEYILDHMSLNKLVIYNKVSYLFNIFNISLFRPITAFEGYLDSLFFPNSIGCVGTNTDLSFLEDNDVDLRYFYDNDDAGYRKSAEKIKIVPVFLWTKLLTHLMTKVKKDNIEAFYNNIKTNIKDLNKLAKYFPSPYSKLELEQFFSKDKYDIKHIPIPKKIFYDKSKQTKFRKYN